MYFENVEDAEKVSVEFNQKKVQSCLLSLKFVDGECKANSADVKISHPILDPEVFIRQSDCTNALGSSCSDCLPVAIAMVQKSEKCDESLTQYVLDIKSKVEKINSGSDVKIFKVLDVNTITNYAWKPMDIFLSNITHEKYRFVLLAGVENVASLTMSIKCIVPYWSFSDVHNIPLEEALDSLTKVLAEMKGYEAPLGPDELLEVEIVDLKTPLEGRYNHVLLIFDCFSNWLEISLLEKGDIDEIINNIFISWTSRYGNPISMLSGTNLHELDTWAEDVGITHKVTSSKNAFSRNFTSMHRELIDCLSPKPESDVLMQFVYQFNRTVHRGLENTPFNLHHCRPSHMFAL